MQMWSSPFRASRQGERNTECRTTDIESSVKSSEGSESRTRLVVSWVYPWNFHASPCVTYPEVAEWTDEWFWLNFNVSAILWRLRWCKVPYASLSDEQLCVDNNNKLNFLSCWINSACFSGEVFIRLLFYIHVYIFWINWFILCFQRWKPTKLILWSMTAILLSPSNSP